MKLRSLVLPIAIVISFFVMLGGGYWYYTVNKDQVISGDGYVATLTQAKCKNSKVLELASMIGMPQEVQKDLKAGTVVLESGATHQFCYVSNRTNPSYIFVIDDEGGMGNVPLGKE